KNIQNHLYRGYTIVPQFGGVTKSLDYCPEYNKPLYLSFGELNNWHEVGRELMAVVAFRDIILRLQEHLTHRGISISNVLLNDGPLDRDDISVIGPVAVQIAIIHLLSLLDVKFDGSFGCSLGELVSAYCNEILTLEETIDCAFTEYENFIGLEDEYNLNGDTVDTCEASLKILSKDHAKSKRANHFMNILRKNRYIEVGTIKPNSIILQIGNGTLNDREHSVVRLFGNESKDHLVGFLTSLGSLYVSGYNPQINRLYPRVDFPVSSGTAMISPYVRWKHNREIFVPNFSLDLIRQAKHGIKHYRIETNDSQWAFVVNNVVDGKRLFPTTGYLYMVWETFSLVHGVPLNTSRVSLRNCRFLSTTRIPNKDSLFFRVSILIGTGEFEVIHGTSAVATGTVSFLSGKETEVRNLRLPSSLKSHGLPLKEKDVYKELRLRGYNYSEEFRAIEETDLSASKAYIKWHKNWTAFMDNMLQLKTLQSDSRLLQVPIFISELNIVADVHFELVKETCRDSDTTLPSLPVYSDSTTGKIRCGGIAITGVITNSVPREKHLNEPVLESIQFLPNSTNLDLHNSVRVNTHIILENTLVQELKVVELIDDFSDDDAELLSPIIKLVLQDEPLVQPLIKILSTKNLDIEVEVTNNKLGKESNCQLVIASKVVTRPEVLREAFAALKEDGFIMSRENHSCEVRSDLYPDITIVTVHRTTLETILLVRKRTPQQKANYIKLDSSEDFSWVPKVQIELNRSPEEQLVLYSEDSTSGILGMVKCLRREPRIKNIRCVFVMNDDAKFNPNSTIYREQLRKNLAVNVYKNGEWGTLRHLPLEDLKIVESEQCFVNITNRGVKWTEGPLRHDAVPDAGKELIYVYYSSLNFRDVRNTHGKINSDVKLEQECVLGVAFSGRDKSGTRVMGWSKAEAPSNLLLVERSFIYQIPDDWTLDEAATVPSAYMTAIYALIMRGNMKSGESILIHDGTVSLGQAAIYIALHYGCKVFTTVGTKTQHDFIKKMYPQLKDENIGNSHDATFEQMIYKGTNGRGIDLVLNFLTEEKLVASLRCLAKGGRFLQVGNPDSTNTNRLNLLLFEKQASFHGIALDETFSQLICCEIRKLLKALIREGAVKPLNGRTFKYDDVEQAFEFMTTRSNIGKVLVMMREPEEQLVVAPSLQKLSDTARYYCDPKRVYMIVGGLGGFGLELADWLVLRGARKLVLTSRKGITTGYQRYRIKLWQSYGTVVKISTIPVTSRDGCKQSIEEALELGTLAAVFNLAVVLADAIFENQTTQSFAATFEPKAVATKHLDDLTRTMCADLREFVVFSSVCCGRGNAGQSNYGMANSVMERICDNRKQDGFPALAIEWGAIGETGIAAENEELVVTGSMQQSIFSCLDVLDVLLTQKDASVVSSLVVAEKHRLQSSDNVVEAVVNIIGLKDAKCVSPYSTLAELGLDSMIAVEIKLMLERLFQILVSTTDLRTMTLASLKEIEEGKHQLCLDTLEK
ncbi:fatty acid synthase, partial [Anoplophora glabripennis]|uniref:fatty acid synthase n=1 Tax=Anoplophora glabripennis TaxID=217634 RepID=UPI000C771308